MLHLFRKNGAQDGSVMEPVDGAIVVSHILVKFLKRLRQNDKPRLLDLGRLSGPNIEFFARRGCKVQVEDLLLAFPACEETPGVSSDEGRAQLEPAAESGSERETTRRIALAFDAPSPSSAASGGAGAALRTPGPAVARRPACYAPDPPLRRGARPTRHIVLPPRTFASPTPPLGRTSEAERPGYGVSGPVGARSLPPPAAFVYPDDSFDAVVAWDIFNYFDPAAMTLVAAETRRVLKPGGLLLGFFHARRPVGPEMPRRYRIIDEKSVTCDADRGQPLRRHVYQNRDIEKFFAGLSIVELYFLKNATRELLMEKKPPRSPLVRSVARPRVPRPRFNIE